MSKKGRRKAREEGKNEGVHDDKARSRDYTSLAGHTRKGSTLTPPLLGIQGGLHLASWLNERVPEMLWGALITDRLGRNNGLGAFRILARHVHEASAEAPTADATLSGLGRLPAHVLQRILADLSEPERAREALRPLLLIPALPARQAWSDAIRMEAVPEDWDHLARAVALVANHQSQEATDLRWARVITVAATGRVHLPVGLTGLGDQILGYPDVGDMRSVRPTIRSLEGALDQLTTAGGGERVRLAYDVLELLHDGDAM